MQFDLGYIDRFGVDVSVNVQKIFNIVAQINTATSLPAEASCIDSIYNEFDIIGKKATETRTYNWARLGGLLADLQDKYNKTPGINRVETSWSKFARENFTSFGKRRREQAVKLHELGASLEKYYFLGIDQILYVFPKLLELRKKNSAELKSIQLLFDFSINDPIETEEEQKIFRTKITNICEYEKNLHDVIKLSVGINLYHGCISVGCKVTKEVIKQVSEIKDQNDRDEYFLEAIANRGFSIATTENNALVSKATCGLLCKIIDNVDKYQAGALALPEKFRKTVLTEALDRLKWLDANI